ncbi:MAG: hypothetical protein QNJ11_06775 [Woeseiaceae bacterium]|nr:hypothetical protein [Woeseiaceae bacterium]
MTKNTDEMIAALRDETYSPPPHVKARWHEAIDEAAALEQRRNKPVRRGWHPASFLIGVAVTAALALGVGIGFIMGNAGSPAEQAATVVVVPVPRDDVPVALARGLQLHFRDSRAQILALDESSDRSDLVWRIVEDNRIFEAAATRDQAPQIARVLRAIEPILLKLASEDLSEAELADLQTQLAFEMNVMLTKLTRQSSDDTQTT